MTNVAGLNVRGLGRDHLAVGRDVASNVSTKAGCRSSGGAAHDRLGAVGAAAGFYGNFAEAFRALLGGGIGRLLAAVHAGDQGIDREDDEEINDRGDQDEGDGGVDEIADREFSAADK